MLSGQVMRALAGAIVTLGLGSGRFWVWRRKARC